MTKFWWVNQGQTYVQEVGGGYMWAPKTQRNGVPLRSYGFMLDLRPGDVVYSHYEGAIRAKGRVREVAISSPQPANLLTVGESLWLNDGWLVMVDFETTLKPVVTKGHFNSMSALLLEEFPRPISSNGTAAQKTYLTAISPELAKYLDANLEFDGLHDWQLDQLLIDKAAREDEQVLLDEALSETERKQVVMARVGQGAYRLRVLNFERACRVTGVTEPKLLIASHIKPWSHSSNLERVNGANGLMLAPHVDKLFDKGLISFKSNGQMIVSSKLPEDILPRWSIDQSINVGKFSKLQDSFLDYHRDVILK